MVGAICKLHEIASNQSPGRHKLRGTRIGRPRPRLEPRSRQRTGHSRLELKLRMFSIRTS